MEVLEFSTSLIEKVGISGFFEEEGDAESSRVP
jgi:hypothetical protein